MSSNTQPRATQTDRHPAVTPARRRELLALAKKIDGEEKDAIVEQGRAFFTQLELVNSIVGQIKAMREDRHLSVTEVGNASGIGKANVSRLENGQTPNPTFDTLYRYARAVGVELRLSVAPIGTTAGSNPPRTPADSGD